MTMEQHEVRTVEVTYADGSKTKFDPIVGYHRAQSGHDRGLPNPGPMRRHHEIRWSEDVTDTDLPT